MAGTVNNLSISCDDSFVYLRYKYLHDIGHVLGLSHEHQRYGRDAYVKVHYENIQPGMEYTYIRMNLSTYFGPYDYNSLMHYPATAFAKSGQNRMGQTYGLSKCDVVRLNILYNCTDKPRDLRICRGDSFPSVCLDISDDCETWLGEQKAGTCDAYPGFYKLRYCSKSCDNCDRMKIQYNEESFVAKHTEKSVLVHKKDSGTYMHGTKALPKEWKSDITKITKIDFLSAKTRTAALKRFILDHTLSLLINSSEQILDCPKS
uniref:Metalloendopeptidase n=1 Tax=Romanomermis culicivorax TaxID=13658 RepID=A0A915I0L9_ROMCU